MKTFNNSDLFTGYLKQLLHDFNLPKIKVYTKQHERYKIEHGKERPDILGTLAATPTKSGPAALETNSLTSKNVRYFPYIKDGEIQEYVNNKWQNIQKNDIKPIAFYNYTYGKKLLNYTKTLKINSNIYDPYTHEYLGDYLRFHRDFLGLDLMPLYNCFSNKACEKLNFKWTLNNLARTPVTFSSSDPNFKIYMLPVKLFQKYTIAIDSELPIEMCCGIYGDYQDKRTKFASLPKNTYRRVTKSIFSQPFLYDALAYSEDDTTDGFIDWILDAKVASQNTLIELAQNECDLKLFLKVPVNNTSTIVVLEGDYCGWNDSFWNISAATGRDKLKKTNKSVINVDYTFKTAESLKLITPLQLLQFNTGEQHPFADRLIEYLIGNAITNSETEIADNVKRAQKALASNSSENGYIPGLPGVWSNEMRILFYEYMTARSNTLTNSFNINHDILGYIDKDVEKFYQATIIAPKATTRTKVSLANIELEEEDK